jgi:hypothetical protein
MPKVTKTPKVKAPRPSPVTPTVGKAVFVSKTQEKKVSKPRKPPAMIISSNHDLPTVVAGVDELSNLQALRTLVRDRHPVEINALFTRQNKFGGLELQLTDEVHDALMDIIVGDMEFDVDANKCCVEKDPYTGHWRLRAKFSKAYLSQFTDPSQIPIPEDDTIVHVNGALESGKMNGKDICYFQIDSISKIVSGDESEDEE